MRFLHTADWHLGRTFYNERLTTDQSYVLDQVVQMAVEEKADAVLVSGDIYDRAVPPPEAVSLLDDVLSRLILDHRIPVLLIAGNHDSPERLAFGSRLLSQGSLHVVGSLAQTAQRITLGDAHGPVHFHCVPYSEPEQTRAFLQDRDATDHDSAMRLLMDKLAKGGTVPGRSVLLAHAFVTGGESSESERPLMVGGAGTVDACCFDAFSYVALGHLHRPQSLSGGRVQYAGSLMKYSFSEAGHEKAVNLVEIDAQGACHVRRLPLRTRRDVRCVQGLFQDLLTRPLPVNKEDYLMVTLEDDGPVLDALDRLRQVYPNVMQIGRSRDVSPSAGKSGLVRTELPLPDLFASFFRDVTSEDLSPEQRAAFERIVTGMYAKQREATAS